MSIIRDQRIDINVSEPKSVILEQIEKLEEKQKHTKSMAEKLKLEVEINHLRSKL